jgi:hypothetical protein
MENGEFNNLGEFDEYGDVDGISGDKDYALPHARRHGCNIQVTRQHAKHTRMLNVSTVSSKSDSLELDIGSSDDEGDIEGIGD